MMWPWLVKMPAQKVLRLLLLLMLILRNVLATVWFGFGSWSLVKKLNFFRLWTQGLVKIFKLKFRRDFAEEWSEFAADACLRLWSVILVEILKLDLVDILKFKFSKNDDVWLRFWSWCLVDILKMKCEQDLCKNLWYDLNKLLWYAELNSRVRCSFGNVYFQLESTISQKWECS